MSGNNQHHLGVMPIPQKVMQKWKERQTRGDKMRIQQQTKLSRPTITKALNDGKATMETILAISRFYAQRRCICKQDIETEALKILNATP